MPRTYDELFWANSQRQWKAIMAKKQKDTLRVLSNPFAFGGDPLCACATDPVEHVAGRYVGAIPVVTEIGESITVGTLTGFLGHAQHDVDWQFSDDVQEVPNTAYYRQQLKDSAIVPADAETAAKAGLKFTSIEQMRAKDPNAKPVVKAGKVDAK